MFKSLSSFDQKKNQENHKKTGKQPFWLSPMLLHKKLLNDKMLSVQSND